MKEKRNNKKKVINKKQNDKYNEIYGIIIIAIGILTLLSIFTSKTGIIGSMIKALIFSFMGIGAYFFAIIIILIGIIFILDGCKLKEKKSLIYLMLIFLCVLVIYDNINPLDLSFVNRIENSIELSKIGKGGGILGSIFGFFMYKLFGTIGTYLVTVFLIVIYLLTITDIQAKNLIKDIFIRLKRKKVKKDKTKLSINTEKKHNEKDINIIEYKSEKKAYFSNELDDKPEETENQEIIISGNSIESYTTPSLSLLKAPTYKEDNNDRKEILNNAKLIEETMGNFGIDAKVSEINIGPTITCYELQPAPGIKISKIVSLSDNISLSLASSDIRIEAPIPGKSAIGIEVPNRVKSSVLLKEIINSKEYEEIESEVPIALGKDVSGNIIVSSIDKMPHLLIAGATGSGKSVCINTIIMSIIYKSSPKDVKLLLIDPKVVELSIYNGIPHLLIPVVTDAKKASFALNWAVTEMENRYKTFAQNNVRDISAYNNKIQAEEEKMSKMIIIIDELADLMMVAAQEVEDYICRLAQMARAAGIYLIVATQRPSVDVITGTIKANIPSRISFAVSSQIDSRTILDMSGAEKLLGKGDMLFFPSFYSKPTRIQGAFISDLEVENVVNSLKTQEATIYDEDILEMVDNPKELSLQNSDELFTEAVSIIIKEDQASISFLQRKLKIGYARAARLIDAMEERGIVSGSEGNKPRRVLITEEDLETIYRGE